MSRYIALDFSSELQNLYDCIMKVEDEHERNELLKSFIELHSSLAKKSQTLKRITQELENL